GGAGGWCKGGKGGRGGKGGAGEGHPGKGRGGEGLVVPARGRGAGAAEPPRRDRRPVRRNASETLATAGQLPGRFLDSRQDPDQRWPSLVQTTNDLPGGNMMTTLGPVAALATALALASLALPATGATLVYVGCTDSNEIHVLQLNPKSGDLSPVETVTIPGITKTAGSTPMAISPDKKFLFAATRGE